MSDLADVVEQLRHATQGDGVLDVLIGRLVDPYTPADAEFQNYDTEGGGAWWRTPAYFAYQEWLRTDEARELRYEERALRCPETPQGIVPDYTRSLNGARLLLPPGYLWSCGTEHDDLRSDRPIVGTAVLTNWARGFHEHSRAATPELALCIVCLLARGHPAP